jgi:FeS assembly SUF system protein
MDGKPMMQRDMLALGPEAAADLAPPVVARALGSSPAAEPPRSVADGGTPVEGSVLSAEELEQMTADIVGALKTVYDPEIPSDIYELGLIYKIDISDGRHVTIDMTLTAPGCPVAGEMPVWVENAVCSVAGVQGCTVNLTFDPPWDQSRMSDEARLALNMF